MNQIYPKSNLKISYLFYYFSFLFLIFNACKTPVAGNTDTGLTSVTASSGQNSNKDTTKTTPPKKVVVVEPQIDTMRRCDTLQQDTNTLIVVCFEKIGDRPMTVDTVDIIQIIKSPTNEESPTIVDRELKLKTSYRVVIIMPFMSKNYTVSSGKEIPVSTLKAIEFYEGVQIALDSLEREGLKLFVDVFDSMKDTNVVKQILQKPALQEADLIIGPIRSNTLRLVAQFAKANQKVLASPFNSRNDITQNNPYYIQLNPSFSVYSQSIMHNLEYIKQSNRYNQLPKRVFIVAQKSDSAKVKQLQEDFAIYSNSYDTLMPQYLSSSSSIKVNFIRPLMDKSKLNIILIPSNDEGFVYNCLREIQSLSNKVERNKGYQIAVVGMDRWKYFNRITFEYYEALNLHLASSFFVNKSLSQNINFKNGYKSNYGIAPREFGYIGFDAMLYLGRMLHQYGSNFQMHLAKEKIKARHTTFSVQSVLQSGQPLDSGLNAPPVVINYFENKYVHFLKFQNYKLQKVEK